MGVWEYECMGVWEYGSMGVGDGGSDTHTPIHPHSHTPHKSPTAAPSGLSEPCPAGSRSGRALALTGRERSPRIRGMTATTQFTTVAEVYDDLMSVVPYARWV